MNTEYSGLNKSSRILHFSDYLLIVPFQETVEDFWDNANKMCERFPTMIDDPMTRRESVQKEPK